MMCIRTQVIPWATAGFAQVYGILQGSTSSVAASDACRIAQSLSSARHHKTEQEKHP